MQNEPPALVGQVETPLFARPAGLSYHSGSVVVTITVDVRNAAGHKIDERTSPPISLNYPHGKKLDEVLAVVVASVAEQYEAEAAER